MCNINVVYSKKKSNSSLIPYIMNVMSYNSYQRNGDGEGYLALTKQGRFYMDRGTDKFWFSGKYYFMATHQRLATKGLKDKDNAHPYPTDNLLLMHNGVLAGLGDDKVSDTYQYMEKLDKAYVEEGYNILKAVQKVSKDVTGSYSILLYEVRTGKVYYYKNYSTNMTMVSNDDWFVMSTSKDNTALARFLLNIDNDIVDVKEKQVYRMGIRTLCCTSRLY